jgi:anti-anti-sigma factor
VSERASTPGTLAISADVEGGTATISLVGELDLASAGRLEQALAGAVERLPARIVIDLTQLAFIDSSGLRVLLQAASRSREQGYELVLLPGSPSIQKVFEVTGALQILRFESPQ